MQLMFGEWGNIFSKYPLIVCQVDKAYSAGLPNYS